MSIFEKGGTHVQRVSPNSNNKIFGVCEKGSRNGSHSKKDVLLHRLLPISFSLPAILELATNF